MRGFLRFMAEGGWGMWAILVIGGVCIGGAVRFAQRQEGSLLRFTAALWLTVLAATCHSVLMNLATVFRHGRDLALANNPKIVAITFAGFMEAVRPAALGGIFLTLAPAIVAIGVLRARGEG
jgi:hypothetical protein